MTERQRKNDAINPIDGQKVLSNLLASKSLKTSPTLQKILRYLVTEELEGRGNKIKALAIGLDAMGKPDDFDPHTDPSVRVNMGRLRSALNKYYQNDGKDDLIKIEIPKGKYRPIFHVDKPSPVSQKIEKSQPPFWQVKTLPCIAALCVLALVCGFLWIILPSILQSDKQEKLNQTNVIIVTAYMKKHAFQSHEEHQQSVNFIRALNAALSRNEAFSIISSDDDQILADNKPDAITDFQISGLVQEIDDSLTLSLELINTHTQTIIWARQYVIGKNSPNLVIGQIIKRITRELTTRILTAYREALEGRDPKTLSAAQLFVMATWVPGLAKNALAWEQERINLAQLAIEKDPDFGPAYSVIADKLIYLANMDGPSNTEEAIKRARNSAQRAMELSSNDANTLFNIAQFQWHSGKLNDAIRTMRRVLDIDPNHALALGLSRVIPYTCIEAPDDLLEEAIAFDQSLDPDNPIRWVTLTWLGWLHLNRGEYEMALEAEKRSAQIFQTPYSFMRHAVILNLLGRHDEASELIIAQRKNWPNADPEHFSTVTMPRLCHEQGNGQKMIGFYKNLTQSIESRLKQ